MQEKITFKNTEGLDVKEKEITRYRQRKGEKKGKEIKRERENCLRFRMRRGEFIYVTLQPQAHSTRNKFQTNILSLLRLRVILS